MRPLHIFTHAQSLWKPSCSKCSAYGMGCFGTYFTHAQRCENLRVQSATERTASVHIFTHCPKAVITFMFKSAMEWAASVHTLHMPKACENLSCSKCSATEWLRMAASVHNFFTHAQRCETFVFNVLQKGLLRYIFSCMPKAVITFMFKVLWNMGCFGTYYLTHAQKVGKPSCSKCYRKFCVST